MAQFNSPHIELLPEHIIDQIKAGEVLERPASLLKELIENSLDAGSTEIHIQLVENGMDLLSIEDDGMGMSYESLPFAFLRHATSKIKSFEDIYRLRSFGFRGEALASLAASARVTCTTQPQDLSLEGGKIIIHGGKTELLIPQKSNAHGTSLFIKDLFFNTPARLKFIKSKVSEKSSLKKLINSFFLSNPQTTFSVKWDDKEKEIYKAVAIDNNIERIKQVFFSKKSDAFQLLFQEQIYDSYRVRVYFTTDTFTAPQYRHHYLFVNNRFFQDKSLHQAILRNMDRFWKFGESGYYVVQIDTPPEDIDVNVHPNKTQIKFLRSDVVYSLLVTSIKNALKNLSDINQAELNNHSFHQAGLDFSSQSPSSFFSKADEQEFDLKHFSAHPTDDFNGINLFSQASVLNSEQKLSESDFFKLSEQFIIYKKHSNYLIDLKKLFIHFLSQEMENFILSDESYGPLLISEPFKFLKGKIDTHFEDLKQLGFEFDRLNNEYIVLRTIPKYLPHVMLQKVSENLLNYFAQNKVNSFNISDFKIFQDGPSVNYPLEDIPQNIIDTVLKKEISQFFASELTTQKIQNLFKI